MVVVAFPRVPTPRLKFVEKRFVVVAVVKYPVPLAVKFVVEAPPFMEKRPAVMVELALEMNPLLKVARSDWENAPVTESVPKVAVWE